MRNSVLCKEETSSLFPPPPNTRLPTSFHYCRGLQEVRSFNTLLMLKSYKRPFTSTLVTGLETHYFNNCYRFTKGPLLRHLKIYKKPFTSTHVRLYEFNTYFRFTRNPLDLFQHLLQVYKKSVTSALITGLQELHYFNACCRFASIHCRITIKQSRHRPTNPTPLGGGGATMGQSNIELI